LGLPSLGTKLVSIMTFGSRKECHTECNVVKLGLEHKNNALMELKLLKVSHICEPLMYEAIDLSISILILIMWNFLFHWIIASR
uniref:Uncharacterized protein n=1 Tax=Amphimedon queenslandica TaxID=400682 RepID=A0A1X7U619_AMPQE